MRCPSPPVLHCDDYTGNCQISHMSIRNWYVEEGRKPAPRQESLAVPEMAGGNPPRANNPWQCQSWVASTRRVPGNPGSANSGWRRPSGRQESLAVPEMAGGNPPHVRKPWQCQSWVASTRCMPENPGSANPGWKAVTRVQAMWGIGCIRFPARRRARRRAGS